MALGLGTVAPKLIFGKCPDVDSVKRTTPDGWVSGAVGKWYVTEADVDFYNYIGMDYDSFIFHFKCDPVSGKCECYGETDDADNEKNCLKHFALEKDVDPQFFVVYDCAPATLFWIPIPFFTT